MRDIFLNSESFDDAMTANLYNTQLSRDVCFEDRTEQFQYSNDLHQIYFVEKLKSWLKKFRISYFEFIEPEEGEEIDMNEYMKFDDWWVQFEELRNLIDLQYEKCRRLEEENNERDCNRLAELAYNT